ncbi:hypothetical protein [Neisseria sp.]|uniref:DUF6968 family protein n=1 Tax=Neisseria sp. TaxID=192066 RepID=UPI0035A19989
MDEKLTRETAFLHRVLEVAGSSETVDVFIGKPYEHRHEEWHCRYRIVGAGKDMNFGAIGIDGVQALQLAFNVIEASIIGADLPLRWLGETDLGFTGRA